MMPPDSLRILLVEDDELLRLGLHLRLQKETGLEVVAFAENGETALQLVKQYPLDIVLLDIGLSGIGGIEACHQLKEQHPDLPILVLASHSQKTLIRQLVEVGVQGYCQKGVAAETLVLALRSVANGASWWDPTATTEIRAAIKSNNTPKVDKPSTTEQFVNPLTRREQEILVHLAAGNSDQEIAQSLLITPGTVRVHVYAILRKLQVRDRTKLVAVAIKKKLIEKDLLSRQ